MEYVLKYNLENCELLGVEKRKNEEKRGYIKNEKTVYIPCKSKEDAIKTYKSILRENINFLKKQKRIINDKLIMIKNKLQETEDGV